ncbi:type II toxin-antitoxin system RelE family toxin [Streptomyces sp.]|uniref:type II toxin-antitoxin system RelE family toxin n=1 Tax=Streptomyces sp. TaxID=1931 RepID=UPI002D34A610|nr:type II toxin-antitoxin system RelE/ParE family toxin [Streptomyces sp.]HZF89437.1 type II toxin-antitoxin system RelE/ParE family toxin [Streptomyces sp.]
MRGDRSARPGRRRRQRPAAPLEPGRTAAPTGANAPRTPAPTPASHHRPRDEQRQPPAISRRLRAGSHRVAYQVNDGELVVLVVKVGDRRDVYRNP